MDEGPHCVNWSLNSVVTKTGRIEINLTTCQRLSSLCIAPHKRKMCHRLLQLKIEAAKHHNKTLSQLLRLLSSFCCFSNSPHCFGSRSLFPPPSPYALFTLVFTGFLPSCAWSIKHTCELAPSPLHPPPPSPGARPETDAEQMTQHGWMSFSN